MHRSRIGVVLWAFLVASACTGTSSTGPVEKEDGGTAVDLTGSSDAVLEIPCLPQCTGLECGDDGCGGSCGKCPGIAPVCQEGSCVMDCTPDCSGRECGDDGCGDSCGECEDGLSCTLETCAEGSCTSITQSFFCLLEGACVPSGTISPDDPCSACQPAAGQTMWTALKDGTPCDGTGICYAGACCQPAAACADADCGDDGCGGSCGTCLEGSSCDAGQCTPDCTPDCTDLECGDDGCGGSCGICAFGYDCEIDDDSAACVADCGIQCGGKQCGSAGADDECDCGGCDDNNACTDDSCSDNGLCQFVFNDSPCDDGNVCTGSDGCDAGLCVGKLLPADELAALDCICQADADCLPLEDGDICDGSLVCTFAAPADDFGSCQIDPDSILECNDENPCTNDTCSPVLGCLFTADNGANCADSNACNGVETCLNGECVDGNVPTCDDENPCTADGCNPDIGCTHTPDNGQNCSDGNICNGIEPCIDGTCGLGSELDCDDGDKCTSDLCEPTSGCYHGPADGGCFDDLDCTKDTCSNDTCYNALQPYWCVIDGTCVPGGAGDPDNNCQECQPKADPFAWSYLGDGIQCSAGQVCYQGICCNHGANCAGLNCGDDGCGGNCGSCPADFSCQEGLCVEGPCIPDCLGKTCGPDGCGDSCGGCPENHFCTAQGDCLCLPQCSGKACGNDGCGGTCGACPNGYDCVNDLCEKGDCVPDCQGKACGPNGCDGSCGSCPDGHICTQDGACVCIPDCTDKECGNNGCGGNCGSCPQGQNCANGICGNGPCVPDCGGKDCGPDGCGELCGNCLDGEICDVNGACVCLPDCSGLECGDNGCGGSCGSCNDNEECSQNGQCVCVPDCQDKECGTDGCVGSCGSCDDGFSCVDGSCVEVVGGDSCAGKCGGASDNCYCDNLCFALDTCCDDVCDACPDLEGCTCGNGVCDDGEDCGTCPEDCSCGCGEECIDNSCTSVLCEDLECGDDGCGGTCGSCDAPQANCVSGAECVAGTCEMDVQAYYCYADDICVPSGAEKIGEPCKKCLPAEAQVGWTSLADDIDCGGGKKCHGGICCNYDCDGKQCGDDGCGGSCGSCIDGVECSEAGLCNGCDDGNDVDWDGCTDGVITEFRVNAYWTGSQYGPDVASLTGGGFAVAWDFGAGGNNSTDVHVRIYDKNGKPYGVETMVPPSAIGMQASPRLVALPDGGFLVFWHAEDVDTPGPYDIWAQRYNSVGSKIGAPFVASPDSSTDNRYCRPILLKSGNLLVVYSDNDKNDALYAQQLTTDGVAVGFKVSLGHNATTNYRVVALTTGGFLALYPRSYKTGGNWAQLFDENTIALDNKFPISDDTTLNAYHNNPNAALLAGGEVVVAFNANLLEGGDNSAGCFSRRMTQAGTFLSDDTQVNTTVTGSQQVPLPVALSDGRYAIYWQGWADEDTSGGIHLQRYAADHSKLGSETRVNTYTDSAQGLGAVAVLPDDSQIVVYSSNGQDGSSQGIFAQRFSKDGHKLYR